MSSQGGGDPKKVKLREQLKDLENEFLQPTPIKIGNVTKQIPGLTQDYFQRIHLLNGKLLSDYEESSQDDRVMCGADHSVFLEPDDEKKYLVRQLKKTSKRTQKIMARVNLLVAKKEEFGPLPELAKYLPRFTKYNEMGAMFIEQGDDVFTMFLKKTNVDVVALKVIDFIREFPRHQWAIEDVKVEQFLLISGECKFCDLDAVYRLDGVERPQNLTFTAIDKWYLLSDVGREHSEGIKDLLSKTTTLAGFMCTILQVMLMRQAFSQKTDRQKINGILDFAEEKRVDVADEGEEEPRFERVNAFRYVNQRAAFEDALKFWDTAVFAEDVSVKLKESSQQLFKQLYEEYNLLYTELKKTIPDFLNSFIDLSSSATRVI